ncbi:hypothetical protein F444_17513, partial [Phytophthora nicotianae P1976]
SSLNHTPVQSLGNRAPVELFCELSLPSPLTLCMDTRQKEILELPELPEAITDWLDNLQSSIHELHQPMVSERAKQTERNKRMQKYARRPSFDVGDYVLRSRVDQKHHDKLLVTWVGPYQVARADQHSFCVRHLLTGDEADVQPSRLKFYADKSLLVSEELRDHVAVQGIVLSVEKLNETRWNKDKNDYEVLISWKGLESIEDSWESTKQLSKDIPVLLTEYAATTNDRKFERHIAAETKLKPRSTYRPSPQTQQNVQRDGT